MSEVKLSNRYAKALLDEALQNNNLDIVFDDVVGIKKSITSSKELASLLKSPIISSKDKIQILNKIFPSVSKETIGFIKLLSEKNREKYLFDIADAFINQYYNFKGITLLEVTSSVSLESESLNKIVELVKSQLNLKEVKVSTKVDDKIIGGLVLRIGNKILDASIATRLENFKRVLTA